jgi:hypothetical protein
MDQHQQNSYKKFYFVSVTRIYSIITDNETNLLKHKWQSSANKEKDKARLGVSHSPWSSMGCMFITACIDHHRMKQLKAYDVVVMPIVASTL